MPVASPRPKNVPRTSTYLNIRAHYLNRAKHHLMGTRTVAIKKMMAVIGECIKAGGNVKLVDVSPKGSSGEKYSAWLVWPEKVPRARGGRRRKRV